MFLVRELHMKIRAFYLNLDHVSMLGFGRLGLTEPPTVADYIPFTSVSISVDNFIYFINWHNFV